MKRIFNEVAVYHLLVFMILVIPHSIYTDYIARRDISLYLLNILVVDGILLAIIYINVYVLIPRFQQERRYITYFLLLGLLVILFVFASYQVTDLVQKTLRFPEEPIFYFIVSTTVNVTQYLLISFFLYNLIQRIKQQKKMGEIQLENLKTEINYLRAQINPHFLFNTLNNLYGLALEKSDKTPEIIMRLSKMMDYMLYESEDATVYLRKDIENIQNYVEIERIRQGNNAVIQFSVQGEPGTLKIVPLLLLPLVENGFKHGVNKQIKDAFLDVHLSLQDHSIELKVANNYKENDRIRPDGRTGIGLNNLRRRLELFYPGRYELSAARKDSKFEAFLKIALT